MATTEGPILCERKPYVVADTTAHTMGQSLYRYLAMKIHHLVDLYDWKKILVLGAYDRTAKVSATEKKGKLANWQLPTASVVGDTLYLKCFPGRDYVLHYSALVASHLALNRRNPDAVRYVPPTEAECLVGIKMTNLADVSVSETAVIGWGMPEISGLEVWGGSGPFLYGTKTMNGRPATFIICQFSFWGDIAGRVVAQLAEMGFSRVIYVGKLGGLKTGHIPNRQLATGGASFVEREMITWNNPFATIQHPQLTKGVHCSVPSILYETKTWLATMGQFDYVDPEIGHCARAAKHGGIAFGYLHLISDNVAHPYGEDLSNERLASIVRKRRGLLRLIRALLEQTSE